MKVRLIDWTGKHHPDPMHAAKLLVYVKSTRLSRSPEEEARIFALSGAELDEALKGVATSIRSSWEFVNVTFEVVGASRACVDQILRTRHGSYAVQAMRVVDMKDFETVVPKTVRERPEAGRLWRLVMGQIGYAYRTLQFQDIPNQDCRGVIPMNACTNFNGQWNLRTIADVCGKRDNLRAQGEYVDFVRQLKQELYAIMPWTKAFVEPERNKTPALDAILSGLLGDAGPLDKPQINQALKEIDSLKSIWG